MSTVLLEYLSHNSLIVAALEDPITIDEILHMEPDKVAAAALLERLPQLQIDHLKISNCFLDSAPPYDSLVGLTQSDLEYLLQLVDYLLLPPTILTKIQQSIGSIDTNKMQELAATNANFMRHATCKFNAYETVHWAALGDLRGLTWARHNGYHWNKYTCVAAVGSESLECVKYVLECDNSVPGEVKQKPCHIGSRAYAEAAMRGNLTILKMLCEYSNYKMLWKNDVFEAAAAHGHLDVFKYVVEHKTPHPKSCPHICAKAAKGGNLELLKYARDIGFEWNESVFSEAAAINRLDIIKYAHENKCPWNSEATTRAAEYGHLDTLKWLHEAGCPVSLDACHYAAAYGFLDILKLLYSINCCHEMSYLIENAAGGGHLECLKWLHDIDSKMCEKSNDVCYYAALGGHLECLRWLHVMGFPWDSRVLNASQDKHPACYEYARKNGCSWINNLN